MKRKARLIAPITITKDGETIVISAAEMARRKTASHPEKRPLGPEYGAVRSHTSPGPAETPR